VEDLEMSQSRHPVHLDRHPGPYIHLGKTLTHSLIPFSAFRRVVLVGPPEATGEVTPTIAMALRVTHEHGGRLVLIIHLFPAVGVNKLTKRSVRYFFFVISSTNFPNLSVWNVVG